MGIALSGATLPTEANVEGVYVSVAGISLGISFREFIEDPFWSSV